MSAMSEGLEPLLRLAVERGASDVHLKVPSAPLMRVDGRLERVTAMQAVVPARAEELLAGMLATLPHAAKQVEFESRGEVDFSFAYPGLGRFRVNAFRQRGSITMILRPVPFRVPSLDRLGLPPQVAELAGARDGLVLVGGLAGSGITTTVAALVDAMNDGPPRSIITVEDPIEILHSDRACAINQREVGLDTESMAHGLARILRHDPDVIVVSRFDDAATVETALRAAQNGVLVVGTVSAASPAECIDAIVGLHPTHRQITARAALAGTLRAVVVQRLVPREDGGGRRAEVRVVEGPDELRRLVFHTEDSGRVAAEHPLPV